MWVLWKTADVRSCICTLSESIRSNERKRGKKLETSAWSCLIMVMMYASKPICLFLSSLSKDVKHNKLKKKTCWCFHCKHWAWGWKCSDRSTMSNMVSGPLWPQTQTISFQLFTSNHQVYYLQHKWANSTPNTHVHWDPHSGPATCSLTLGTCCALGPLGCFSNHRRHRNQR